MIMLLSKTPLFLFLFHLVVIFVICKEENNPPTDNEGISDIHSTRYLLYDVNPPEGFNLRRDVFMRIAILVKQLTDLGQPWKLVLPPWGSMYHWQSKDLGAQNQLPWSLFFDVVSMQKFVPVIEMHKFFSETGSKHLDSVFFLQHFTAAWTEGKWEEKLSIEPCHEETDYRKEDDGNYKGWFWGYHNVTSSAFHCLSFQGHATSLAPFLINATEGSARSVMLDRAEIALHHMFGDQVYWQVRRSMRFSKHLNNIALQYRKNHLESTDEMDNTIRPESWLKEEKLNIKEPRGGNYLCVHLRRRDFTWGRAKDVPSIIGAAAQLGLILKQQGLQTIFVATDAPEQEIDELTTLLHPIKVKLLRMPLAERKKLKDGGLAIIEQIICSHAKFFVGTHESTFSFRIQEEREIMGFHPDSTFNRLCGDEDMSCTPPSRWRVEW